MRHYNDISILIHFVDFLHILLHLQEKYEAAIEDSSKAIELHPVYLKAINRRAELYEKTDKLDEALADYQRVVELDPSQTAARMACMVSITDE